VIREANALVEELYTEKIIGFEDKKVTKFIILLMANGAGRKTILRKMMRDSRFDMWWDNLEKNFFIVGDKVVVDRKNFLGSLVLMVLCAEGRICRVKEEKDKKKN